MGLVGGKERCRSMGAVDLVINIFILGGGDGVGAGPKQEVGSLQSHAAVETGGTLGRASWGRIRGEQAKKAQPVASPAPILRQTEITSWSPSRVRQADEYVARPVDRPLRQPHGSPGGDHVRVRQHAHQDSQRHWALSRTCRVGATRDHENPHKGHGYVPKLILAGRLTGVVDGRPVVISADESGLVVVASSFRTVWESRRSVGSLLPVLCTLKRHGVPLWLSIAGLVAVEVLPKPSLFARIFAPSLSSVS